MNRPGRPSAAGAFAVHACLGLALALCAAVSFHRLSLPGFYDDEAVVALRAREVCEAVRAAAPSRLPLVLSLYHGAHSAYLTAPVVALFPGNVAAFRAFFVLAGLAALALAWLLCRELFESPWVAPAAALMLATHVTFVLGNREGAYFGTLLLLFSLSAALCFARWLGGGPMKLLWAAAFLLGLGLGTLATFVYALGAHAAVVLWLLGPVLRRIRKERRSPGDVLRLAALFFAAGAAPVLLHALSQPFTLLMACSDKLSQASVAVNDPLGNLRRFRAVIDGTALPEIQLGVPRLVAGSLFPPRDFFMRVFCLSAALTAGLAVFARDARMRAAARGLAVWGAGYAAASFFTLTGWVPAHLSTLFPFPQVVVAFAAASAWRLVPRPRWLVPVLFANFFVWNAATDLQKLAAYFGELEKTGGRGSYSSASAALAEWAVENRVAVIDTMDWGLHHAVPFMSNSRVAVRLLQPKQLEEAVARERPARLAVYRSGDPWTEERRAASSRSFREWAAASRIKVTREARFFQRDGTPALDLFRCE